MLILQALLFSQRRTLLRRMVAFGRNLPQQFDRPLPQMMAHLTPVKTHPASPNSVEYIRRLADAVSAWQFQSPLGICLRRSLMRYHFLRQAGVPVTIVFGARKKDADEGGGIGGHAWLTLNDVPYHESPADFHGFAVMYSYPQKKPSRR